MNNILRVVLHPASSVVVAALLVSLILHAAATSKVLLVFFGVLLYMCLRPSARRNNGLWRVLSQSSSNSKASGGAGGGKHTALFSSSASSPQLESLRGNCVVVSIPVDSSIDVLDHAIAFGRAPETSILSLSTVLYICRKPSERAIFWMPLARLMLWMLGGLMEYSRGLLLQLLKRKAKRPLIAVVLLPAPVTTPGKKLFATLHIDQKGIFAAALKTGSTVIPAVVLADGSVAYGSAVSTTSENGDKGVSVPSPDQVRRLSSAFGEELVTLYKTVANVELRVD
jgi:hypothetical protein